MRIRLLLALVVGMVCAGVPARVVAQGTTPTEAKALAVAETDHTAYQLPPETLAKAQAHSHDTLVMFLLDAVWGILQLWLLLKLGIVARMRDFAAGMAKNRWMQGLVFLIEFVLVTTILTLPLDMISHHISVAYGLSVQGWGSWFGDMAKGLGLLILFGWLALMIFFWIVRKSPKRWWVWGWMGAMVVTVLAIFVTPVIFDPMFNKFEPLQKTNPELVVALEKVVARGGIEIPPERMFLMKASAKVTTLNAYVTGFGASKRVVVWDTSLQKGTTDQISFIFGHEMGHYVLNHIPKTIAFVAVVLLVVFYLGYLLVQWMLRRYGAGWGIASQNDWGMLVVFLLVVGVLSFFTSPIINAYSRGHEHDADVYGQEAVHGIVADPQTTAQSAFQLLGENGLSNPYPNALVQFWEGSHPAIGPRAGFARAYNPWAPGEAPKYFKK